MIQELLQKWSELEPDRCVKQSVSYSFAYTFPCASGIANDGWYSMRFDSASPIDRAILLSSVLDAIVSRNLRVQLENSLDGWRVVLLHPDEVGAAIQVLSNDHTIALLTAYVQWLEKEAKR